MREIAMGKIDLEPDWKEIAEWIISSGDAVKFEDEIRQMANLSSIVRRAQKSGCRYLDLQTGECRKE